MRNKGGRLRVRSWLRVPARSGQTDTSWGYALLGYPAILNAVRNDEEFCEQYLRWREPHDVIRWTGSALEPRGEMTPSARILGGGCRDTIDGSIRLLGDVDDDGCMDAVAVGQQGASVLRLSARRDEVPVAGGFDCVVAEPGRQLVGVGDTRGTRGTTIRREHSGGGLTLSKRRSPRSR